MVKNNGNGSENGNDDWVLTPIQRLNRDLMNASVTLSDAEARFLVDAYYGMQDQRIRADGQLRSIDKAPPVSFVADPDTGEVQPVKEPHEVLSWFSDQNASMESQIKRSLERYVIAHPVGSWLIGTHGIGPVISAGLLAHIDINRAPTVGHIWRFAGLDSSVVWKSAEHIRGYIKATREASSDDWEAFIRICREQNKRPLVVLHAADIITYIPTPEKIREFLNEHQVTKVLKAEFHADNMLQEALSDDNLADAYRELCGDGMKFDWKAITRVMTKRPWNAQLKVLTWKAGQSFMKFSKSEKCTYGQMYREKKQELVAQNEQGKFADKSKEILGAKKFGKETEAFKHYSGGHLPPAHVDARARRFAVKQFLSDLHAVWHFIETGVVAPKPWIIEHGGHVHFRLPAGIENVPGLREAYQAAEAAYKRSKPHD